MTRGKKTTDEEIAKVVEAKINTNAQGSTIAEELWIPERTVNHIINTQFARYLLDNPERAKIYESNRLALVIKDIENLGIDKDILSEYISFTGWYKESKEYIEWFMLQSIGKSYIRRKAINKDTRYSILERAWFKCQACGSKPDSCNSVTLEIDHIVPYSMWWLCVNNNYQVLCMQCNISKGNKFIHNHNENER